MRILRLSETPLSVPVIAGRTAWNSFHKGGNYSNHTNNITEEDKSFLLRLFRKYKHLSVSEHIRYTFLIQVNDPNEIMPFLLMNKGYFQVGIGHDNLKKDIFLLSINARDFFENAELLNIFFQFLPNSHKFLYRNYENVQDVTNYEFEQKNGNLVDLLYINKIDKSKYQLIRNDSLKFYTIRIKNVSRACLQEIVRHDHLSAFTVKSTRYTLKELKEIEDLSFDKAKDFIVMTNNEEVDNYSFEALKNLQKALKNNISNDIAKYCLPESYKTELIWTLPEETLSNFIQLRKNKSALWEIQNIAKELERLNDS